MKNLVIVILCIFVLFQIMCSNQEYFSERCPTYLHLTMSLPDYDWRSIFYHNHGLAFSGITIFNDSLAGPDPASGSSYFSTSAGFNGFRRLYTDPAKEKLITLRKERGGIRCTYSRPTYMAIVIDEKRVNPQILSQLYNSGWREKSVGDGNWKSTTSGNLY